MTGVLSAGELATIRRRPYGPLFARAAEVVRRRLSAARSLTTRSGRPGAPATVRGDATVEDSLKNLKQVRAMVVAMADSAATIVERDQRYRGRLQGTTDRFHTVSRMPNVNAMQAAVTESAAEMNASWKR